MSRQLLLDLRLPVRAALGRGDFFVAPSNALALAAIDGWAGWPGRRLLLTGPEGSGKTHLAHVWARLSGAAVLAAADLVAADLPALLAQGAVAVEDACRIAADPAAERALFHLCNLAAAEGAALLLTARGPVSDWGLRLPDLESRMQAMAVARLGPPDEALLAAVLVKLFADRQLAVAPAVIPWLVARIDRSLGAAARAVARLDAASLAGQRRITPQLAAKVLDSGESQA